MRGITTRLVVATIVVVAFVVTALSGLVLYRPVQLLPAFGISLLTWRPIHDWGALVLTAAVIVHLILHRRRVGQMIAGLARPARPAHSAPPPVVARPQDPAQAVPPASADPEPRRLRLTRRRFLIGFGALLAGLPASSSSSRPSCAAEARPAHRRERRDPRDRLVPRAERRAGAACPPGAVAGDRRRARGQAAAARPRRLVRSAAPQRDRGLPLRRGLVGGPAALGRRRAEDDPRRWRACSPPRPTSTSTPSAAPTPTVSR